ncbi:DUF2510 domain-containing protein [Petropleomorpha daqingensis]|uniref:DUF2510 domain-containing protein n=1 Tax=Petropleomorpha daqingensis TaxID=2026353 RepID=A0A853CB30_9ACTN|nr:hypothetical protein [Petropleomorpha daqingensis]
MSEPGTPAPGWYPDPDGAPGYVRWWNGVSWSDVTTPAGPGVTVQRSPVLAPPAPRSTGTSSSGTLASPERPQRPFPKGLVVGLSLVALVVVLVVALVNGSNDGATRIADPPVSSPAVPPGPTFAPGTTRIFDNTSGLSYPWLGENWLEWNLWGEYETTAVAGQYFVTQDHLPDSGEVFIAQVTSGPLADGLGWAGPSTLQSTTEQVGDSVRGNYYPAPNEREVRRDEARTVDGHAAWLYEFDLTWHVAGYDSTGERAALLLVDVGRHAPALLYISIPNTHAELYGVIDQVIENVQVL